MIEFKDYMISDRLGNVCKVLIVGSGKGGVGKSTLTVILGLRLRDIGMKVGILDIDLHGASIPFILGWNTNTTVKAVRGGFKPVEVHGIKIMSLRMFVGDRPTPLRGERKSEVLKYMLSLTIWDSLDYLLVDLPPGMSDELLTLVKYVKGEHVVITLPTKTSVDVTTRYVKFLKSLNSNILAVIVNNLMNVAISDEVLIKGFQEDMPTSNYLVIPYIHDVEEYLLKGVTPKKAVDVIDKIIRA